MSNFDTFEDVVLDILDRLDENTDGTSDWDATVRRAVVRAFHHLHVVQPWWWALADPPGAFNTVAPITNRTLTVAAAGTSVAGTLSSTIATSIAGYKIRPGGKDYYFRVTAHTAGSAAITIDAAPEALAAGTTTTIFQDEVSLASDLGLFQDGLWTSDGQFIELKDQEFMKREYPDPPDGAWPARYFCRLGQRKVRFSTYPTEVDRVEYAYYKTPADPSGSGDLVISQNFRWLLSDGGLYFGYLLKSDKRADSAKQSYEAGIGLALSHDLRMKLGVAARSGHAIPGPYGSA